MYIRQREMEKLAAMKAKKGGEQAAQGGGEEVERGNEGGSLWRVFDAGGGFVVCFVGRWVLQWG